MIQQIFGRKDYYKHDPNNKREEGRLVWAPVLFIPSQSGVRKLSFDDSGTFIGIEELDSKSSFKNSHKPFVTPFRLESTEEVLCVKAKKRPVVLLCQADPRVMDFIVKTRALDKDLKLGKVWLTLPLRSYKGDDLKLLVESLYFPVFFPFFQNGACPVEDSYGRFDNIQTIHTTLLEPSGFILSKDIFNMLKEAFISYITGVEYGEIYSYFRTEFLKELKREGILK